MLFIVPNPARSLTTATHGLRFTSINDRTGRLPIKWIFVSWGLWLLSDVTVTTSTAFNVFETCISNLTDTKSNEDVHHYIQWMSNNDSCVELFPPSVPVLPAQLTRVHLVLWGCRTIESRRVILTRCPCSILRGCPTIKSVMVFSLTRWPVQDNWRAQRNYFPIHNINKF